jgi:hypothetical protein
MPDTEITEGDRVGYTVMYDTEPGTRYVTEFGWITRIRPGGPRNEPRAIIAVEDPAPGRSPYVERYVKDIALAPVQVSPEDQLNPYSRLYAFVANLAGPGRLAGFNGRVVPGFEAAALASQCRQAAELIAQLPEPADHSENVLAFLNEQLARDDMSLTEIAAGVTRIATGAGAYEPLDDEDEPGVFTCGSCGLVIRASDTGIYEDPDYPASSDEARYCDASSDHQHRPAAG